MGHLNLVIGSGILYDHFHAILYRNGLLIMQQQAVPLSITIEEYLQGELASNIRHEFFDGKVYAMAGAGERHNLIAGNIFSALRPQTRGSECRLLIADMKLHIAELQRFYYPDILLSCDLTDNNAYYKEHPCLIVEVLSPSTQDIDRREKLHAYQGIPSLQEYMLVSQDKIHIEIYQRISNKWQLTRLNSLEEKINLTCLKTALKLRTIYEDVT